MHSQHSFPLEGFVSFYLENKTPIIALTWNLFAFKSGIPSFVAHNIPESLILVVEIFAFRNFMN